MFLHARLLPIKFPGIGLASDPSISKIIHSFPSMFFQYESYNRTPHNEFYSSFQEPTFRRSHPEVFLGKGVLKICSKFTGDHPCRSVISIKLQSNHTSAWVFSCKLAAYFQNTFSYEHVWTAASLLCDGVDMIQPSKNS